MPLKRTTSRRMLVFGLILFTVFTICDAVLDILDFAQKSHTYLLSQESFDLFIVVFQIFFVCVGWRLLFYKKKLESELEYKALELAASNHELEAFSYSVSHDLRSHLARINGFAQLILEAHGSELSAVCQEYFDRVVTAGKQMDEVLEGLLTLSRLGRTSLDVSQVDLSDLVRVIMAEKLMAENERPVDFIIEPGQVASCDGRLMRIALENLVSNALKFTRKRDRARIEFGVRNSDEKPVWFLSDNGVGFPPEDAERIFQPFQRVHSEAEFPGNGIGLATVHRIIKLHGGKIRAEGDVDKGACFYFSL